VVAIIGWRTLSLAPEQNDYVGRRINTEFNGNSTQHHSTRCNVVPKAIVKAIGPFSTPGIPTGGRDAAAGPKKVLLATKPYFSKKHITKYMMMPPATLLPRIQ